MDEKLVKPRRPSSTNASVKKSAPASPRPDAAPLQRAANSPGQATSLEVAQLQRALGNHAVSALLDHPPLPRRVQPKLNVGALDDPCEHEADQVARQVLSPPSPYAPAPARARGWGAGLIHAGQAGGIQRWGLKAGWGVFGASGHETLTAQGIKQAMGDTDLSDEQKAELKKMKKDIVAGSRWNDMLHNSNIASMGIAMHKEGTLTNLSHEGELSAIHAMAASVGEQAWQTRHKIMMWAEFCYKVATEEIKTNTYLGDVEIDTEKDFEGGPTIKELFKPWAQFPVGWLFTGSKKFDKWEKAKGMALGSMMHMLQDSFCQSHAQREAGKRDENKARLIKGFNAYTEQSSNPLWGKHGKADAVLGKGGGRFSGAESRISQTAGAKEAVDISATVLTYFAGRMPWPLLQTFLQSQLGLTAELEAQEPKANKEGKKQWDSGASPTGNRTTAAAGRLFRKESILSAFRASFGWAWTHPREPYGVKILRGTLEHYDGLLNSQVNNVNKILPPEVMLAVVKEQKLDLDSATNQMVNAIGGVNSLAPRYYAKDKVPGLLAALNTISGYMREDQTEVRQDIESLQAEIDRSK